MPSGSVTLLEAAQCGNDTLKRGVVETLIQESPLMEMLPWVTIQGNAFKHRVEDTLPAPAFRDVNETYTRSFGTDTEHFWGTSILGGEVFVDNVLLKVVANVISEKAKQYTKFAKAMSRTFDASFFDGTGTAKDFKGVNTLVTEGFGQAYVVGGVGNNGATMALDDLDQVADLMRNQASGSAWLVNRFHRRKVTNLARSTYTGFSLIDIGTDVFGRKVTTYNDVPFRIIGDDINGTAILGFDETVGSSNVCSSMYLATFSEDFVAGLLGMGGSWEVVDFGETQAAPGHLGRVECYPGIGVFNSFGLIRVSGITKT